MSDFAFSTVWNAWRQKKAVDLISEIVSLGFSKLELSFGLPADLVRDILDLVNEGRVEVVSLHNYCPAPILSAGARLSHSLLPLSSLNEAERTRAVRQTGRTLEIAKALGASAVVVHLGVVPLGGLGSKLIALLENGYRETRQYEKLKRKVIKGRERRKRPYLEQAARSLKSLARAAEDFGIRIGVENRYYPEEIPSLDEIGDLLQTAASPAVGYWHDLGHAQVKENIGWEEHDEYLRRYGDRLIGMHIHDVVVSRDHKAPLQGDFDFKRVRGYLEKEDILKVLEVHPQATAGEIKSGLDYLKKL